MARYWVGGSGNWSDATNHWATTSGGAPGAGNLPTATDDVIFDAASSGAGYTVTIDNAGGGAFCRDITFAAPATGDVTWAGSTVGLNVSGSFALYAGMTVNYSSSISFLATSGTRTITSAGKSLLSTIVFNGSGATFQLADNLTINGVRNLTRTAGTFDANGKTVSLLQTAHTLTGFTGSSAFFNLTRTANAVKTDTLTLGSDLEVTGTFTASGNSSVNRLLVLSSVKGTARTITAATVTVTNADFQDITGAGAGSWDLSAITGLSGDCGGNSGITFTSPVTNYWVGGTGNWDAVGEWASSSGGAGGSGRVPLPQDTARFDANSFSAGSQTVTQNMTRIGSVDWTGVTNTPTWTTSTVASFFGSITLVSGMTLTGSTQTYTYEGRGSSTLTSAGHSWSKSLSIHCMTGSLTLGYAFTNAASSSLLIHDSGTFNSAGFAVTTFGVTYNSASNQTFTMGSSLWTITRGDSDPWVIGAWVTVNAGTSTIRLTGTLTAARTFSGAGKTYYRLENATTGAFALQILGSNTFTDGIYIDASSEARTIQFTAGTTTTVGNITRDAGTNIITIGSITAANHNLVKSGGGEVKTLHHMSISRSQATPGTLTWYANIDSTDGGNNSGWIFGVIPPGYTVPSTAAVFSYVAKAATSASTITRSATAAVFNFVAKAGASSSTITRAATVASFLFNSASALARSVISVPSTAASFAFNALAGSTSTTNPDPRNIPITVSLSANPAIVVSRSSYSITVSE